jgi:cysteine desulfurase
LAIYLDHASTTPLSENVKQVITDNLSYYGNPSSMHRMGVESEKKLKSARREICSFLEINERELIFTSGGTEANNLAILGSVTNRSKDKSRYITTKIEHPSVLRAFETLERLGYEVIYLSVNIDGLIDVDELKASLNDDTVLVSVMAVNNELGSIQPIEAVGKAIYAFNETHHTTIRFHVDGVQALGKMKIDIAKWHIDLMSFSAHKINGLKGIGALYCNNLSLLKPLVFGGQQEFGIRPGTENLLGIVAFSEAIKSLNTEMTSHSKHVQMLKDRLLDKLLVQEDIVLNGINDARYSPYIVNVSFIGIKGEVLLHSLEMKDIYVATGSACSSKKKSHSHVLSAMGYRDKRMEGAIRFSFGYENTLDEIDQASDIILSISNDLSKIMNKKRNQR